jgi:hypothetical protein
MAAQLLRFFLVPASLVLCSVAGAQAPDPEFEAAVPVPEDERRQITLSLLERYPQLASSPGVKAASATAPRPGETVVSSVVFYPHAETHGIKEAFQTLCQREEYPSKTWVCDNVTIRRYFQLASQDFEVRVNGEITAEAVLALIEASRRDLRASVTDGSSLPDTAIMVNPQKDGRYFIHWGVPQGFVRMTMLAQLTEGGDPTNPDDWHASIFKSPARE